MAELSFGLKIWGDISGLVKSLSKGKEEVKSFGKGADYAFKDLTKSVSIAENQFKKFAVQLGVNSKEAQEALVQYRKLKGELNNINQSLRPVKSESMFSGMKNELLGMGAGFIGVSSAVAVFTSTLKTAIEGAMADEAAEKKLSFALDGNADKTQRLIRFKDQLMETTLFSEDDIMSAMTMGTALGRTEQETKKLVETAMGLSRATGVDLNTAMMQLSATYEGNIGKLGKLAGDVKGLSEEQLKNGEAVDLLNDKYGKFASEGLDSVQGQVSQMKKYWGETLDSLGSNILEWSTQALVGIKAVFSFMGGGYGTAGQTAEKKYGSTMNKLFADHQKKMDDINAKADISNAKNPQVERLKSQYANQEKIKADLAKADEQRHKEDRQRNNEKILDFERLNRAIIGGSGKLLGGVKAGMIPTGGNGLPAPGLMQGVSNTKPQTTASTDNGPATMDEWTKAINEVSQAATGLGSTFQNVFTSVATLAAKVKTGFEGGWKDAVATVGAVVQSGMAVIGELFTKANDKKLAELDQYYSTEKTRINGSKMSEQQKAKAMDKLDADTATKRKVLLREQAKQQRTVSLMQAAVAGGLAIVQAFASGPGIGVILGLIMTGLVAAQIASIASQPLPALAQGGLASAPTMALVGDNPNARIDPEVIAPLSKLKDMMFGGGDTGGGQLSAVVRGDDLLFVLDRAQRSQNRRY